MRPILSLFFLACSFLEAKSLFFEEMENYLKNNDYAEYTFKYKKIGIVLNQEGQGTLLLRKNGDFLIEVPFAKDSLYVVKFENEMFFELVSIENKHTYKIYSDPSNLQIGFALEALKNFSLGVPAALGTLNKNFTVKITHDGADIKAKLSHEILQSLKIQRLKNKTQLSLLIKPEEKSQGTQSIEVFAQRSEKAPLNAASKFILDIPESASIARIE